MKVRGFSEVPGRTATSFVVPVVEEFSGSISNRVYRAGPTETQFPGRRGGRTKRPGRETPRPRANLELERSCTENGGGGDQDREGRGDFTQLRLWTLRRSTTLGSAQGGLSRFESASPSFPGVGWVVCPPRVPVPE